MSNPDPQQCVCCGGPLLCPAFFLEVNIFQNHSLLSFSFPLLQLLSLTQFNSPGILSLVSIAFLWDFDKNYKNSMEILCNFYGVSVVFYGVSKGVSMVVLWDSYWVSKGCLWDFLWIPMGFLWYFYEITFSMGFLWDVRDISIGFL